MTKAEDVEALRAEIPMSHSLVPSRRFGLVIKYSRWRGIVLYCTKHVTDFFLALLRYELNDFERRIGLALCSSILRHEPSPDKWRYPNVARATR
jgi:hypothetical protein